MIGKFGKVIGLLSSLLSSKKTDEEIQQVKEIMLKAIFLTMGCLAISDNKVQQNEYLFFEKAQNYLRLNKEKRKDTLRYFKQGIEDGSELESTLLLFKQKADCELIEMFLTFQLKMIYADGYVSQEEFSLIFDICSFLGISSAKYAEIDREVWSFTRFQGQNSPQYKSTGGKSKAQNPKNNQSSDSDLSPLSLACSILKIQQPISERELKKIYRRLLKENHPDKMIAQGLPDEMIKIAEEKVRKIYEAYECIQRSLSKAS